MVKILNDKVLSKIQIFLFKKGLDSMGNKMQDFRDSYNNSNKR